MFIEVHPKLLRFVNGIKIPSKQEETCLINTRNIIEVYPNDNGNAVISMEDKIYELNEYYSTIKNLLIS